MLSHLFSYLALERGKINQIISLRLTNYRTKYLPAMNYMYMTFDINTLVVSFEQRLPEEV